jgi:hypothetical protein
MPCESYFLNFSVFLPFPILNCLFYTVAKLHSAIFDCWWNSISIILSHEVVEQRLFLSIQYRSMSQQQPGDSGDEVQPYRIRVSQQVPYPATEELTDESII